MRLVKVSVSRYRSIEDANAVEIGPYTALVGANNVGKSNLLRAISLGMEAIRQKASGDKSVMRRRLGPAARRFRRGAVEGYDWDRDFPVQLQQRKNGSKETRIRLDFSLNEEEEANFYDLFKARFSRVLPLEVNINSDSNYSIRVIKKGNRANFEKIISSVCEFVSDRVHLNYIPTVRTKGDISTIVSNMLEQQMYQLQSDPEYIKCIEQINVLQEPILERLGEDLSRKLQAFVPNITEIKVESGVESLRRAIARDPSIWINDGNLTKLEDKGDGVQSLVA